MSLTSFFRGSIVKYWNNYKKAKAIISYYESKADLNPAEKSALSFIKHNQLLLSNQKLTYLSNFINPFRRLPVEVHVCNHSGLSYVNHKGKRLYFPRWYSRSAIIGTYRSLLMEQDKNSPHLYWSDGEVFKGNTLFDIGAAEGFVTLDHIDDLEQAYLFECDHTWIEALNATFKPYSKKVTIIERYVSDRTDATANTVCLDDFVREKACRVDLLKMDIEGYEELALEGARETLMSQQVNLAVCAYHKPEATTSIVDLLTTFGYQCSLSPKLMCFMYDDRPPYFRTGMVYAHKKTTQQP